MKFFHLVSCLSRILRYLINCTQAKQNVTRKASITLRIKEILIKMSSADLKRDLQSIVDQHPGLKEDCVTITQLTLIQMDQKIACATATFCTSFSAEELIRELKQAKAGFPYRFDVKFHGITPIYEAQGGADVE